MTTSPRFKELIDQGILSVHSKQGIGVLQVEDKIAGELEYSHHAVEYWRRGNIPNERVMAGLVRYCVENGMVDYIWAKNILAQAHFSDSQQLLNELFRSEDGHLIGETEFSPPLSEFNDEVLVDMETPGGVVKLRDELYVEREADRRLRRELIKSGTTTIIRAPRQTGKTSLLIRGLDHAFQNGAKNIDLNLQSISSDSLASLDTFLHFLAGFIIRRLNIDLDLDRLWRGSLTSNMKLTEMFRRHILTENDARVVLVIDEADRLLPSGFSADFFGLVRSWHENRARDEIWNRLNIVLVISTEPYLLISDLSQSPFNVGYKIQLEDFDIDQVRSLNHRHGAPLTESEIPQFVSLLNGHPYLTRLALYTLATENISWNELNNTATGLQSPFSDHLRHQLRLVLNDPDLRTALNEAIKQGRCTNEQAFFRLQQAGLVKGVSHKCTCRCQLYYSYFEENLL